MPENPQQVEYVTVQDPESPSGPRDNVPARLNGKGIEILGEDEEWHVVEPEGKGRSIIQQVLDKIRVRHIHG